MNDTALHQINERERLLVMAAYLRELQPTGWHTANCGKVLGQALLWAGLWNDLMRSDIQGADEDVNPIVDEYNALIAMTNHLPASEALMEGWGNLGTPDGDPPAAASFTACGLTQKGRKLAKKLFVDFPQYNGQSTEFFKGL